MSSSSSSSSSSRRVLAGETAPTPALKRSRPALPTPSPQTGSPFPPGAASPSRKRPRVTLSSQQPAPVSPSPPARYTSRRSTGVSPGSAFSSSSASAARLAALARPSSPSPSTENDDLPPPLPLALSNLMAFHRALSLSLAHTLAAHPPVLPPKTAREHAKDPRGLTEETILLRAVANWEGVKGIREVVERGAGRKCTGGDLKRLLWLYEWDGRALPTNSTASSSSALSAGPISPKDHSPFVIATPAPAPVDLATAEASRSLLSLSLAPTRTLAKGTRTPTYSYAFNLLLPVSGFAGGVVGSIGRWSADQQAREKALRARLEKWDALSGGATVPMKVLQPLPGATVPAATSGAALLGPPSSPSSAYTPASSSSARGLATAGGLPTPPQSGHSQSVRRLLFPSPSTKATSSSDGTLATAPSSSSSTPPSTPSKQSASDRRQSLRDRIAAKEAASAPLGGLFASAGIKAPGGEGGKSELRVMSREELKRRSTLSRLSGVAEAVFMLFTTPTGGLGSPGALSGVVRRKAIPIDEVCNVLVKSSKVEISFAEARESLQLLSTLTPNFLSLLTLASTTQIYVELHGSTTAAAPVSPGRKIGALGGSGSPGRVVGGRGAGLRDVREAIRRELGE